MKQEVQSSPTPPAFTIINILYESSMFVVIDEPRLIYC